MYYFIPQRKSVFSLRVKHGTYSSLKMGYRLIYNENIARKSLYITFLIKMFSTKLNS